MKSNSIIIQNASVKELVNEIEEMVKRAIQNSVQKDQGDDERLLTRKETSELLRVSLVTLHSWNKLGVLPAFSIGTRVYYRWVDVQNAMKRIA